MSLVGKRRLNTETAERIRRLYKCQGVTLKVIAARFGLHKSTVSRIVNNIYWRTE